MNDDIADFARRHGLERLTAEELARLDAFRVAVGRLGESVPRTATKEVAPWPPRAARAD
jgi:hypothetical protein